MSESWVPVYEDDLKHTYYNYKRRLNSKNEISINVLHSR